MQRLLALPGRLAAYVASKKTKLGLIGVLTLVLYVAQRRGYIKQLFMYGIQRVEKRITKQLAESAENMNIQQGQISKFGAVLKDVQDETPTQISSYIKRLLNEYFRLSEIKESLRAKDKPTAEKNKIKGAFTQATMKSITFFLTARTLILLSWTVRDLLILKVKEKIEELNKKHGSIYKRLVCDSGEATKDFISNLTDSLLKKQLDQLKIVVETFVASITWKNSEAKHIDDIIAWFEEVRLELTKPTQFEPSNTKLEPIELVLRKLPYHSKQPVIRLVHKSQTKETKSLKSAISDFFGRIFDSNSRIEPRLKSTILSRASTEVTRGFSLTSLNKDDITGYLLCETRRRSQDKLSTIVETNEMAEDCSSLVEESYVKRQNVYEESTSMDICLMETQQTIISELKSQVVTTMKTYLDELESPNMYILLDYGVQLQFRKFCNRLRLLQQSSEEYSKPVQYHKFSVMMSRVFEEEFLDPSYVFNDLRIYEARSKQLYIELKKGLQGEREISLDKELSLLIAEEAKAYSLFIRGLKEFAARVYFDDGFEEVYGEEFSKKHPNSRKELSNGSSQPQDLQLMEMLSKFQGFGEGAAGLNLE